MDHGPLCGLPFFRGRWLKIVQKGDRPLRMCRGLEDGALVIGKNPQPGMEV